VIAATLSSLRLNHAFGAAAIFLAALAIWPWLAPPVPSAPPAAAPKTNAPAPFPAALPPQAAFAAIIERPLFTPSRRPAPGAAAPSSDGRYRLLGIVGVGAQRRAFVADGARRIEISQGETFDSWTVREIAQDHVLLTSQSGEMTLKIKPAAAEPPKSP
jgi:hypothetical protein